MKGSIGMILVLFVTSTFGFHTMGLHHMISDHLVKRSPNHIGKISIQGSLDSNQARGSYLLEKLSIEPSEVLLELFQGAHVSLRDPWTTRSGDRQVRIRPRFSKFCWSELVRDFFSFLGLGPSWSGNC